MCEFCVRAAQLRADGVLTGTPDAAEYFSGIENANGGFFSTPSGDQNIDGLLIGTRWTSTNLTYTFPTSGSYFNLPYEISPGNFDNGYVSSFVALNASWRAAATEALDMFAAVSGLTFTAVSSNTQADIVMARTTDSDLGTASGRFPTWANEGHQWYRVSNYDTTVVQGTYTWATIIHETGHTVGLAHGHNPDSINSAWTGVQMTGDRDSMEFSIMTYRSHIGGGTGSYTNEQFGYAQTLMMYDIAALQYLYGANFSENNGNTTYIWDPSTGDMFINGVQATDPGANRIFLTIWDGGGIDTYNMSNYTTNLVVDLTPGSWSTLSDAQLANLGNGNFARANVFNAMLYQNNWASLIEHASGGSGNDIIVGNRTGNRLEGNNGNDTLVGAGGNDDLRGGAGDDILWGDASAATSGGGSGIGFGSGLYSHANIHDSAASAFNLTNTFSLAANGNIADATTTPHTTMRYASSAGGQQQWYRLDVNAGSTITMDIDSTSGSTDTYIRIYAANGTTVLAFNDDAAGDPGSTGTLDSGLTFTVATTGTYYLFVGEYPNGSTFEPGDAYDLHVSVSPPASTGVLGTDGTSGSDVLNGGSGDDELYGGRGNDILVGGIGADALFGGSDWDTADFGNSLGGVQVNLFYGVGLFNEAQGDTYDSVENVNGSVFNDIIRGTNGANILDGRNGNDFIIADAGNDILRGGSGNDILRGGIGADQLIGGSGFDTADYTDSNARVLINLFYGNALQGHAQGDTYVSIESAFGSAFNDIIRGSAGNNAIRGNGGNDILIGDGGADLFQYASVGWGNDLIQDFTDGVDKLDFRGSGLTFADLTIATSGGDTFVSLTSNPSGNAIKLDNFVGTLNANDFIF